MKTPSSSGKKKKKKNSGVSPGMDLTRFGFSVKKRSASEVVVASPPKSSVSAKNNNNNNAAGNNNEDDANNMESPLKRHKPSSPTVNNNNNFGGVPKGTATPVDNNDKKKSPAATTGAALFDLTQSSSSEEAPSSNNKDDSKEVVSKKNDGATAKNEKSSFGGLASSIANQIVAASSFTNSTNNTTQQQRQQQQHQLGKQRRGKRDKVIPNKNKATVANKSVDLTKPRGSTGSTGSGAISKTTSAVAKKKSLSPSKAKNNGNNYNNSNNNNFQALALVRVIDPHEITCSTAVANARRQDQKQQRNTTTKQQQSWTPKQIFNGAILGRSSSSAHSKPNFVDLDIGNRCMGISRNHITILTVRVKSDNTVSTNTILEESQNNLSQTSTTSHQSDQLQSTVTLQVSNSASNGVNVHRTKRGSRKVTFLSKSEKMTLRVGDALEFYSNEKLYFCVVGLESSQNVGVDKSTAEKQKEVVVVEDDKKVSPAATTASKRISNGGSTNGEEKKKRSSDEVEIVDVKKKQSTDGASKASLKTPRNETSNGTTTFSTAKSTLSVEEIEDTPRFPPAATSSPISHVESATKATVAKRLNKKLQKSPMGPKSPKRGTSSSDENKVDLAIVDSAAADDLESAKIKPEQEESEMIKKGDTIKARFEVKDWFGETQLEWYFGTVVRVKKDKKKSSSKQTYEIDVVYADHEKDTLPFPNDDIEKVDDHSYPDSFFVGDSVDAFHQNGLRDGHEGRWYRGRIASISEDGSCCDVLYIDGDYESYIPTQEKKIRLIKRADMSGGWMMNKKAATMPVSENSNGYQYQTGLVTSSEEGQFCVKFSDGTIESFDYAEAATGVFACILKDIPQKDISIWNVSSSSSAANTARLRRQMKEKMAAMKESVSPKPNTARKSAPSKSAAKVKLEKRSANVKTEVVAEPTKPAKREIVRSVLRVKIDLHEETDTPMKKGVRTVKRQKLGDEQWQGRAPVDDEQHNESQDSYDSGNAAGNKRKAKDFPPGLANVIWCALNSPEPQTGANLLRNMLCVQNIVPPLDLAKKLMDLLKFGPKAEGSSVYFKDPLRTALATSYACALVSASSRLVRKDSSAIFGPSSWDDVEVLLSQSIDQTENAISGRRLAQGLQMAACGSKLLSLMLKTELLGNDLSSTSFSFDAISMKLMPTVKVLKSKGLRNVLKAVVRHTTSCMVRHSKWILDHDLNELSPIERASAECCASEAKTCFDSLGSVVCFTAWLFCAEEGVGIHHPNCAFVVKDEFLSELTRCIDNLPEMNSRKKTTFTKKLKLHFLMSLVEEFAFPLQDSVGKMIGLADVLDCV